MTVEWMKPRIKSMIWDIRKQKQPIRTTRRKKNPKKEDSVGSLCDNFKLSNSHVIWGARRRQERARNWKSISKNNERKLT